MLKHARSFNRYFRHSPSSRENSKNQKLKQISNAL